MVYFEDISLGDKRRAEATYTVTRDEIIDFGRRYDPQPFHVDEAAAKRSLYGGLIASGWHTSAMCMRLAVDEFLGTGETGSLGSPGVDEIRWLAPVRPGDVLSLESEVVEKAPSRSKPDRGVIKLRHLVRNQRGEEVMTMIGIGIFLRRPTDGERAAS